jgi:hypothetical protein
MREIGKGFRRGHIDQISRESPHSQPHYSRGIELTDRDLQRFSDTMLSQSIPALVKRTGLSNMLIYNVMHKRVRSISDQDYRILFGEAPPIREAKKVDGCAFRTMVELWR